MKMTHKDQALLMAGKCFLFLSSGRTITRKEYKNLADLCFIVLPMRYRLSREEFEKLTHHGGFKERSECGKRTGSTSSMAASCER